MSSSNISIWSRDQIKRLAGKIKEANENNWTQETFVSEVIKHVPKSKTGSKVQQYSPPQVLAKARSVAKKARDQGYSLSVPRKPSQAAVISDWGGLFSEIGLKPAVKKRKK